MHGAPRSEQEVDRVLALVRNGLSDYEIARQTGIARSTVQRWRHGHLPRASPPGPRCSRCGHFAHDFAALPAVEYAYLLGQYLGDGTIYAAGQSYALRISCDAQYTGIIGECCDAIQTLKDRRPNVQWHAHKQLANITSYWNAWPCLFPQHGQGRKHRRAIVLAPWQVEIVDAYPGRFLRGLIHSDGWRGLNRVHVKGRDYAYPRYQFSNRSDDIRLLFTNACDLLGVAWRPWGRYHVSIARRDAVRRLDQFVGPKT
jgi:hypothetical protein